MTEIEILEYNKRCSDFLGAYFCNDDLENFPNGYWKINNDKMDLPLHLKDMQFHSDWNLIMGVVEAIEKLELGNIKIPVTFSSMFQGVRHQIEEYYDASVVFRIEYTDCRVDIVGIMRLRNDFIVIDNLPTKKEAVVKAINKFLIWYNNEHQNKRSSKPKNK